VERQLAERPGFGVRPPLQLVFRNALQHAARRRCFLPELLQQSVDHGHQLFSSM
jgi:hypothetical protein